MKRLKSTNKNTHHLAVSISGSLWEGQGNGDISGADEALRPIVANERSGTASFILGQNLGKNKLERVFFIKVGWFT